MSESVLYMSMSLDGYIAGPNDDPGNPGGDEFMRLHDWYGFGADGPDASGLESGQKSGLGQSSCQATARPDRLSRSIQR
jgi:hypothetical protein